MNIKYKCHYITGADEEIDGGIWIKKETPKTITFICIEKSFFAVNWDKIRVNKYHKGNKPAWKDEGDCILYANNGNVIKDWKDGTYTIYPEQCGTPHIFEPIKE